MKKIVKSLFIILLAVILVTGCKSKKVENNNQDNNEVQNKVLGNYSREVFSNNTFEYLTSYDTAEFKFNSDSTFECTYEDGTTYKGSYEVYNGLNITAKANSIKEDSSISNAEQLSIDIINVSNAMMSDTEYMLNTYLLYIRVNEEISNGVSTDTDILQPFLVRYDNSQNEGIIVNIFAQTQGSLIKK